MLVLTRKVGERILVGDDIVITVLDARGDGVRIGIDAPRGVKIQREEVVRAVAEANAEAAAAAAGGPGAAGDDAEARLRQALGHLGGTDAPSAG
ncbi:carbon storage regulator CsrA [Curtobacterium sp. ISL-83]|uniref:carbon storage regulator CsrA n=1 Tax=Curtobacterium sp. ISL-83 TaxID=2819145 RepID=UPI001BE6DEDC|nr:carbon storage regulator CsrA [Curtobacterium sp. ISL-83]MBT2501088.1 carbon storage regulator CsrA [Curtobacterium sp. ISL-83]